MCVGSVLGFSDVWLMEGSGDLMYGGVALLGCLDNSIVITGLFGLWFGFIFFGAE